MAKFNLSKKEAKRLGVLRVRIDKGGSKSYKKSDAYKNLSSDEKKLADLNFEVQTGSSKFTSSQLKDALKKAKKDSSGYTKQVLRLFETDVVNQYAKETGDYQSALDVAEENIREINEDLVAGREFLTLEEQRDLVKQAREHEQIKGNLISQIAGTGTTFSSIGEQKKEFEEETNKGIVEGIVSSFGKRKEDLETAASRGLGDEETKIASLKRTFGQRMKDIGLRAETFLGSEKLAGLNLKGFDPIGNISGTFKEDQVKDIEARRQAILADEKQESLVF